MNMVGVWGNLTCKLEQHLNKRSIGDGWAFILRLLRIAFNRPHDHPTFNTITAHEI